jgi:hypothetical protein
MLSRTDALAAVKRACAPATDPALDDAEIDAILGDTATATVWTANTAVSYGQFLVPTVPQGHLYRVTFSGTTDATEPSWLTAPAWYPPPSLFASWGWLTASPFVASPWLYGLKDGTAAVCDFGQFGGELYDVRAAIRAAWLLKAAKASNRVDTSIAGTGSRRDSQTTDFCMRMAASFAPFGFA